MEIAKKSGTEILKLKKYHPDKNKKKKLFKNV